MTAIIAVRVETGSARTHASLERLLEQLARAACNLPGTLGYPYPGVFAAPRLLLCRRSRRHRWDGGSPGLRRLCRFLWRPRPHPCRRRHPRLPRRCHSRHRLQGLWTAGRRAAAEAAESGSVERRRRQPMQRESKVRGSFSRSCHSPTNSMLDARRRMAECMIPSSRRTSTEVDFVRSRWRLHVPCVAAWNQCRRESEAADEGADRHLRRLRRNRSRDLHPERQRDLSRPPPRLSAADCVACVTAAIAQVYGYPGRVVLRTAKETRECYAKNPFVKAGVAESSLHVYFLADRPDPAAVKSLDPMRSAPDEFVVRGRDIYLFLPDGMARTKLSNAYFDGKLKTVSTARNWNTVRKLMERMEEL